MKTQIPKIKLIIRQVIVSVLFLLIYISAFKLQKVFGIRDEGEMLKTSISLSLAFFMIIVIAFIAFSRIYLLACAPIFFVSILFFTKFIIDIVSESLLLDSHLVDSIVNIVFVVMGFIVVGVLGKVGSHVKISERFIYASFLLQAIAIGMVLVLLKGGYKVYF